jgi:hypothetical protein
MESVRDAITTYRTSAAAITTIDRPSATGRAANPAPN